MATVVRRFAAAPEIRWSNGLGRTRELIDEDLAESLTPGSRWRLSVAHLTAPAPFSSFPGRHRTLIPWGGDIALEVDDDRHRIQDGQALRFSGDARTSLIAITTPCQAVNLIARQIELTLSPVPAGTRDDRPTIAIVTEATTTAEQFDVVRLSRGEAMPSRGIVVRL